MALAGEAPAKKNSRITLPGGRTIPSARHRAWHFDAMAQAASQLGGRRPERSSPCRVEMDFWHGDRRRRDSDNGASSVLDLLVDAGVLADDRWEIVQEIRVRNFYDKGKARCEVRVLDI